MNGRVLPPYPDGVAIAIRYAEDIVAAKVPACRLVRLTCQRFLDDLQASEQG
jgi:hypothetical protein